MDVIAAAQAGFGGAVAPLGTALTTEQLEELWRVSACPTLCFDGDTAGARAAARAMDLALPLLTAERSLKFATLPANEDPDSLVRRRGRQAFQDVLDAARAPADALFDMMRSANGDSTPEQRAVFRTRLIEAAGRISDRSLAGEYRRVLLDRFYVATRAPRPASSRRLSVNGARPEPPRFIRTRIDHGAARAEWSRILTAILLRHPFLLPEVHNAYVTLSLNDTLTRLRDCIIAWSDHAEALDSEGLIDHLTKSGCGADLEHVFAAGVLPLPPSVLPTAMPAEAERDWWHFYGFLNVEHLREEVALAKLEAERNLTADTQRRLSALRQALLRVESGETDEAGLVEAS